MLHVTIADLKLVLDNAFSFCKNQHSLKESAKSILSALPRRSKNSILSTEVEAMLTKDRLIGLRLASNLTSPYRQLHFSRRRLSGSRQLIRADVEAHSENLHALDNAIARETPGLPSYASGLYAASAT